MIPILIESSVVILLMIGFRRMFRNILSMKIMYGLWLSVLLCMLPGSQRACSLIIEMFSRVMSHIPGHSYVYFDFAAVPIPWYLIVLWTSGSVAVFGWEYYVNVKFERFLFEHRVRIEDENCPYPVYYVSNLPSSCIFRVKGKAAIYLKETAKKGSEVYRTIVTHEMCHIKAKDLFWAKLRLLFVAVYWFNPLVWIAAFLSKEDCEMACDERTIAVLQMRRAGYAKILLDEVDTMPWSVKEEIFCTATTMGSRGNALKVRIEHLAAKKHRKFTQCVLGTSFLLCCFALVFWDRSDFIHMNEEQTIRQYVYYSNSDNQTGMRKLSLYNEWDYFFPNRLDGEIVEIQKEDSGQSDSGRKNYKEETYKIKVKRSNGESDCEEQHVVVLVKQERGDDWKINWREITG